ncbi:unnamed protein product [Peronospora farinosa]|uniref:Uncharacterized protein n=1 Tax=Peronospora farinosa TaxID=134698 RepID=A0AAV0T135_9STRA|nr:unnamed protein product [Peronospora farinosa]
MSGRRRSRSPRHEKHTRSRSQSRSGSGSHSASLKHKHHHHRQYERDHRRHEGDEEQKGGERHEVAHRSRILTVVNSDESDSSSLITTAKKSRDSLSDNKHRHHSHRHSKRRRSRSSSESSSESESSDESKREQLRHKRKHKHKTLHKSKKQHKKRKKDSKSTKHAVNQDEYGKYGILRESDFHSKSVSFQAWLRDVKNMGEFNGPKWEAMELFKEYMEDYNTCTMPHKKYYDIEKFEMKRYQKQQRKAFAKQKGASNKALDTAADEERLRRERLDAREKKEQEEFRLVLQLMDKDKIEAMREQERLRAQMQLFYKSGNVEEARRLEQSLNKVEEDPRFKR